MHRELPQFVDDNQKSPIILYEVDGVNPISPTDKYDVATQEHDLPRECPIAGNPPCMENHDTSIHIGKLAKIVKNWINALASKGPAEDGYCEHIHTD